jgi:hypothetical protein
MRFGSGGFCCMPLLPRLVVAFAHPSGSAEAAAVAKPRAWPTSVDGFQDPWLAMAWL